MLIEDYVKKNLSHELSIIRASTAHATINLTEYEKALIYKYSDDGFRQTNKELLDSKGKNFDDFGILLNNAISKLPNYRGIVYRKVYLTPNELDKYLKAFVTQDSIQEYPFISTSKSIRIGILWQGLTHLTPNCLFVIYSKNGKEIELMSKFTDEKEVLFKPNTQFNVLDVFKDPDFIQLTMEEI